MTDPMTPLTAESEALLAEVHGTQMALTVFPARLRAIEAAAARRAIEGSGVVEAAAAFIQRWDDRTYIDAADMVWHCWGPIGALRNALAALHRPVASPDPTSNESTGGVASPEEPRVERCAVCGVGRWVIAHDPEAGPSYHPFTPEAPLMDDVTALRELHDFLWDEMEFFNDEADPDHQWTTHALGQKHDDLVERFHDAYPSLLAAAEARDALTPERQEVMVEMLADVWCVATGGGTEGKWCINHDVPMADDGADCLTVARWRRVILAALPRPEEPRVERCAFEYETAEGMTTCGRVHDNPYHRHDPESPPHRPDGMCHPFTPEAR